MAAMDVISAAGALPMAPMALAQDQEADTEIERNNEIRQCNEQEQEAYTNETEAEVSDDEVDIAGENEAGQSKVMNVLQNKARQLRMLQLSKTLAPMNSTLTKSQQTLGFQTTIKQQHI